MKKKGIGGNKRVLLEGLVSWLFFWSSFCLRRAMLCIPLLGTQVYWVYVWCRRSWCWLAWFLSTLCSIALILPKQSTTFVPDIEEAETPNHKRKKFPVLLPAHKAKVQLRFRDISGRDGMAFKCPRSWTKFPVLLPTRKPKVQLHLAGRMSVFPSSLLSSDLWILISSRNRDSVRKGPSERVPLKLLGKRLGKEKDSGLGKDWASSSCTRVWLGKERQAAGLELGGLLSDDAPENELVTSSFETTKEKKDSENYAVKKIWWVSGKRWCWIVVCFWCHVNAAKFLIEWNEFAFHLSRILFHDVAQ